VLGRMVAEECTAGNDADPIVTRNTLLDEKWVDKLEAAGVQSILGALVDHLRKHLRHLRPLLWPRPGPCHW